MNEACRKFEAARLLLDLNGSTELYSAQLKEIGLDESPWLLLELETIWAEKRQRDVERWNRKRGKNR